MSKQNTSSMQLEPSTKIVGNGTPFHIVGHKQRESGNAVLWQVFVNCNVGKAGRQALVALPLHEIPLHRMKHRENGGTVEIVPSWVPNLKQVKPMTRIELEDELARLRGRSPGPGSPPEGGTYVIYRGDKEINLFSEIYGGENGVKITLFRMMQELYDGWVRITTAAEEAMKRITAEEIDQMISTVIQPDGEIDLLEDIPDLAKEVEDGLQGSGSVEINQELREFLLSKGVNDNVANAFVVEVAKALVGKGDDAVVTELPEEAWDRIPSVKKHMGKRTALLKLLAEYDALPAAR